MRILSETKPMLVSKPFSRTLTLNEQGTRLGKPQRLCALFSTIETKSKRFVSSDDTRRQRLATRPHGQPTSHVRLRFFSISGLLIGSVRFIVSPLSFIPSLFFDFKTRRQFLERRDTHTDFPVTFLPTPVYLGTYLDSSC